jgi:hypothetical protein
MWDVQGSVKLDAGIEPAAAKARIESDLRMMAHTTVWPGENKVAFRVSGKRWWRGGLPWDDVDAGQVRIDPAARSLSFQLDMTRKFYWSLTAIPFFFLGGLFIGWSPIAGAAFGIFAFAVTWVSNHWAAEQRVTRYLTQVAKGMPYKPSLGLSFWAGS